MSLSYCKKDFSVNLYPIEKIILLFLIDENHIVTFSNSKSNEYNDSLGFIMLPEIESRTLEPPLVEKEKDPQQVCGH